MSVYAQLEDYGAWSGTPVVPDQASELQFLLNEAEIELEVVAGNLADRITAGLTTAERVTLAVVGLVGRVLRDRTEQMALLAASSADAAVAKQRMSSRPNVGRRERYLVGMYTTGNSLDLSTRDPQVVHPTIPPPYDREPSRGYCP